jgi:hypothetical protein
LTRAGTRRLPDEVRGPAGHSESQFWTSPAGAGGPRLVPAAGPRCGAVVGRLR